VPAALSAHLPLADLAPLGLPSTTTCALCSPHCPAAVCGKGHHRQGWLWLSVQGTVRWPGALGCGAHGTVACSRLPWRGELLLITTTTTVTTTMVTTTMITTTTTLPTPCCACAAPSGNLHDGSPRHLLTAHGGSQARQQRQEPAAVAEGCLWSRCWWPGCTCGHPSRPDTHSYAGVGGVVLFAV
jgi:hypothetical protein